jgi:hypothetical protein
MSVQRDRRNSVPGWKIPRCDQWVWTREPDSAIDGDRGAGYVCRVRATHQVAHGQTGRRRPNTEYACQAHIGDLLDHVARAQRRHRQLYGIEHPPPVVTELTFTVDEKAAAYGRRRFLRTERIVTDAIAQTLIPTQAAIPPAKPRRDRHRRQRIGPPQPVAVQQPCLTRPDAYPARSPSSP